MEEQASPVTTQSLEAELAGFYAGIAVLVTECYQDGAGHRMLGLPPGGSMGADVVDVKTTRIGMLLPVWHRYAYEGVMSAGFTVEGIDRADGEFERLCDLVETLSPEGSYFEWCLRGAWVNLDVMKHRHLSALVDNVRARANLDLGHSLSISELATLARMNERSVRNAVSASGENKLEIDDTGSASNQEARRWLSLRRGFRPTEHRKLPSSLDSTPDDLVAVELPEFIRKRLSQVAAQKAEDLKRKAEYLGMSPWLCYANEATSIGYDRLRAITSLPFDVKPSECDALAKAMQVDPVWLNLQVMTALFPKQVDMLLNPAAWRDPVVAVSPAEPEAQWVTIELTANMLAHGYIDFPSTSKPLFPADCFGTRAADEQGTEIELVYGSHRAMTDIRQKSAKTISPRRRFTAWLNTELGAKAGDRIRLEKTGERSFTLTHIPV